MENKENRDLIIENTDLRIENAKLAKENQLIKKNITKIAVTASLITALISPVVVNAASDAMHCLEGRNAIISEFLEATPDYNIHTSSSGICISKYSKNGKEEHNTGKKQIIKISKEMINEAMKNGMTDIESAIAYQNLTNYETAKEIFTEQQLDKQTQNQTCIDKYNLMKSEKTK